MNDRYLYLPPQSAHQESQNNNIIWQYFTKYKINCSEAINYSKDLKRLLESGLFLSRSFLYLLFQDLPKRQCNHLHQEGTMKIVKLIERADIYNQFTITAPAKLGLSSTGS